MNKVIARFVDGRLLKGFTSDFNPAKDSFHLTEEASVSPTPRIVRRDELKALFFVKDFAGNPRHREKKNFEPNRAVTGRRVHVLFRDGEILIGTTLGYQKGRPGFFLESVDEESNILRAYIVTAATKEIRFL